MSSKWHFTLYYLKVSKNHVECDCRKMTYILSKCLFSQVAGMHTHTGILSKSCLQTNEVEPNSPSPTSFSSNRTVHSLRSEQLNFVSKVFGNGIWGIIETLCHSKVQMADLERLAFQRFLANQKCIRTHMLVRLIASYVPHVEPKKSSWV